MTVLSSLRNCGTASAFSTLRPALYSALFAGILLTVPTISAHAQTTVFADNFNGTTLGSSTTQSGMASPLTYAIFNSGSPAPTESSNQAQFVVGSADNGFTPNYNFANAGTQTLNIAFDFSLNGTFSTASRYLSFMLGTETEITAPVNYSNYYNSLTGAQNGLVILMSAQQATPTVSFRTNGATVGITNVNWTPVSGTIYHVAMTYNPTTFAYTYTLTNPSNVVLVANSGTIANALASTNYMTFGTHNQGASLDNFSVTTGGGTAAPEPASLVLLGVFGAGLAPRIRRRK